MMRSAAPSSFTGLLVAIVLACAPLGCQRGSEVVRLPDSMNSQSEPPAALPMYAAAVPPRDLPAGACFLYNAADSLPQLSLVFRLAGDSWEIEPHDANDADTLASSLRLGVLPGPVHAGPPAAIDVVSFNMEHRDRPRELAVMAEHFRTDLPRVPAFLLLQEVDFTRQGNGWRNTAAALGDLLGYHTQATKRTSDSEGVAIVSKYPFAYYAERNLAAQTSPLLLGFRRVSVMGEFDVPDVGRVRVVNVHLTNWPTEHHVRRGQIRETLEWIARREKERHADVTILGGDFNADRDSSEMELLADVSVTGGLEYQDYNGTGPTRGWEGSPNVRIDFIFVAAPNRALAMRGEQRLWLDGLKNDRGNTFYPSDHVPVLHGYVISGQTTTMTAAAATD